MCDRGEFFDTHIFTFLNEGDPMKKLPFKKIDAFATNMSDGNPAGYINLENHVELTTEEMILIAKQLKGFVSEVGFAKRLDKERKNRGKIGSGLEMTHFPLILACC